MCDYSLVFIKKDGSKEKVMESVELVTKKDSSYIARNIFGEEKKISGDFITFDGSQNELIFQEK
ncbi:hypothetical protein JCM13304A_20470 [Desulfothermus okinawensis JCM 13304]